MSQLNELQSIADQIADEGRDRPHFDEIQATQINQRLLKQLGKGKLSKVKARTLEAAMDTDTLRGVLASDTKLIERAKSIPAKAVRAFMGAVNMSLEGWNNRLNEYLMRPGTGSDTDIRIRNTRRGNYARQAALRIMSWNVLERVFAIWGVVDLQVTFSFRLKNDSLKKRREFTIQIDDFQQHVDSMERLEYDFGVNDEQGTTKGSE